MTLYNLLDAEYGPHGDRTLRNLIESGHDINGRFGMLAETPLHVAARRRRKSAVAILLENGADINALNAGRKTAWVHARRRSFDEITDLLESHGADIALTDADRFAVAVGERYLNAARQILAAHPEVIHTGNPEEDRLLGDIAGRDDPDGVQFLIENGAPLAAPALDEGTPLHIAAWFGQPLNVQVLLAAGAPVNIWEHYHHSNPLGWAVHGARFSGGAEARQDAYLDIIDRLLTGGSELHYPDEPDSDAFYRRLLGDATPGVRARLEQVR